MKPLVSLILIPALACVPLRRTTLYVDGQLRSARAEAERLEDGGWAIRLTLPNPKGSLHWQVLLEEPAVVQLKSGPESTQATWWISRQRWLDPKPLKAQVRNQNGLDLPIVLAHPHSERTLHTAVVIILEILKPLPRF